MRSAALGGSMGVEEEAGASVGGDGVGAGRPRSSGSGGLGIQDARGPPRTVSAWQDHWRQLSLQRWATERDCRQEVQGGSSSSTSCVSRLLTREQVEELRSEASRGEEETKRWENELWAALAKCRKRVIAFGRNVQYAPRGAKDVSTMVHTIEREMHVYVEQARLQYDELAAQECALEGTLEAALTRFEGWCTQESVLSKPSFAQLSRRTSSFCPPSRSQGRPRAASCGGTGSAKSKEVSNNFAAIQEEIERLNRETDAAGGATGGWPEDDHKTFLRLFTRCRRRPGPEFIAEAHQLLPHVTHEELVAHVQWFRLHEDRQHARRQLLERWRGLRAASATSYRSSAGATGAAESSNAAEHSPDKAAAQAVAEQRQRARAREEELREQAKRKQQVADWKRTREERRQREEEVERQRAREVTQREAAERQKHVDEHREAVAAFRQRREAESSALAKSHASKSRPLSAEQRRRIAERNAEQVARRRDAATVAMATQNNETPPRVVKASSAYCHVDSRLQSHTEAYIEKIRSLRAEEEESREPTGKFGEHCNFAHQAIVRPVRSSPSWRPHYGIA